MAENGLHTSVRVGFRDCLLSAWSLIKDSWFHLLLAGFLREWISIAIAGIAFALLVDWKGWNLIVALFVRCFVWCFLQAGYLKLCLTLCETGTVRWQEFYAGLRYGPQMLVGTLVFFVAIIFGFVLLIVPGLVVLTRLSLYGFVLVSQNVGPLESFRSSYRALKGLSWYPLGYIVICVLGEQFIGPLALGFDCLLFISLGVLYLRTKESPAAE